MNIRSKTKQVKMLLFEEDDSTSAASSLTNRNLLESSLV